MINGIKKAEIWQVLWVSKLETLIDSSVRICIFALLITSVLVAFFAVIGFEHTMNENPDAFDDSPLSYDIIGSVFTLHPILMLVLLGIILCDKFSFKKLYSREKKKNEWLDGDDKD